MDTHPRVADAARGPVELADIVRLHGAAFCATHRLSGVQLRALRAIDACRTATLGGHVQQCDACGAVRYTYHSCRNRHCPKCQTLAKERWLGRQRAALLPVPYYHVHGWGAGSRWSLAPFTARLPVPGAGTRPGVPG